MAHGLNRNKFLLKEGIIQIGTWNNLTTLSANSDPNSLFTSAFTLSYFQQGSLSPELNRQYAEFLAGTPAQKIRKDLIQKEWMISAQFAQYTGELMGLVQGLKVSTGTWGTVALIGTDEDIQDEVGYRIVTALTDGTPFYMYIWSGKQTGEAVGPKLSGNAHSTYDFKAEAFPHPNLAAQQYDVQNLGAMAFPLASGS